jgi:hypothetical protein
MISERVFIKQRTSESHGHRKVVVCIYSRAHALVKDYGTASASTSNLGTSTDTFIATRFESGNILAVGS